MVKEEPACLAEVRALAGSLEVQPLELDELLVVASRNGDLVFGIVLVNDVLDDRVRLPAESMSERLRIGKMHSDVP